MRENINTSQIREALRAAYKAPEWAFFEEVTDQTGAGHRRRADGIAMSLWPSRGLDIYGFEIKVSRQDWLKEKSTPAKAERFYQYCDFWSIVAPEGLIQADELPPTWGLMELTKRGLKTVIKAPRNESPILTRPFIASLLRRSDEAYSRALEADISKTLERECNQIDARIKSQVEKRTQRYNGLLEAVRKVKEATGIDLENTSWDSDKLIAGIKFGASVHDINSSYCGLQSIAQNMESVIAKIRQLGEAKEGR